HLGRSKRRRTERQPRPSPPSRESRTVTRFRRLFPISPLSTGFLRYFSLLRLGWPVQGEQVIGTAVPASPRAGNGRRKRQVTKGPISAGRRCQGSSEQRR